MAHLLAPLASAAAVGAVDPFQHDDGAVVRVVQHLEFIHRPMQPSHHKQPGRDAVRHKDRRGIRSADTLAVLPEGGGEGRDAIKDVGPALAVGEAVEEPAEVLPILLGPLDQLRVLKVAKVLLRV